ncbi:MAG: hypothetical protein KBE09_04495 [Candidatus Pacebacteria bacterium]|nr:hypothetical protein [Candidatus Paceibacterota bacterium]
MAFPRSGGFNKRPGGFKGGGGARFGNKRPFDRGARGEGRPEMHSATCANCHKPCEVPFKPDGSRPIYCRDCFGDNKPEGSERSSDRAPREFHRSENRSFDRPERREFSPRPAAAPAVDMRPIMDAAREMNALTAKLGALIEVLASAQAPKSTAEKVEKTEKKEVAEKPAKKVSKKK